MESGGSMRRRAQKSRLHAQGGMTWLNTRWSTASIMLSAGVIACEQTQLANLSCRLMLCVSRLCERQCHSVSCLQMQMSTT